MTGHDGFGSRPTDPRGQQPAPGPPAGAPMQPHWGPPPAGAWGPAGPQWAPAAPPRRHRGPWIIGGAVAVATAIAIGAGVWAVTGRSTNAPAPTVAGAPTTSASARRPFYMFADPADVLPNADEMKKATLLDLTANGTPMSVSVNDHPTVPPNCTLVTSATTKSMWGDAAQLAGQQYTDVGGNTAWVGLAAWDTDDDANASLAKLVTAVQGCPQFVMTGQNGDPDSHWVTSGVQQSERQVNWSATPQGNDKPWKCAKAYEIKANIAATATLCTTNPSNTVTALVNLVLDKAVLSK
ncbi:sensor domain-containing protein [Mycolicibacterium llatzerense]|uniref:sensor domain-containing protein n=1 Tax=Mycolicibacterium llatzerense TaxID=280871 RepID=UPI0021B640E2|nr:sensor domain-containing protein [Mycolicibacterium llatzerense]MCT7372123.1 hypothetical protein [Mycolicibacterium llatzerense]